MKNLCTSLVKSPIGIFIRKLEGEIYKRNLTWQSSIKKYNDFRNDDCNELESTTGALKI